MESFREALLAEDTGIVLVLIPGGMVALGAQRDVPSGPNYDQEATGEEWPVHDVVLVPYFLSKYEMTQAQWLRFTGRNPSLYGPDSRFADSAGLLHPVEQVSWDDCMKTLGRMDLTLPTEAQWEHGARGGTDSPWWPGGKEDLFGAGNVADSYCKRNGGPSHWIFEEWLDDGHTVHAGVGQYLPNPYGLHDVVGNVWEWCRDVYGSYRLPAAPGDGERQVDRKSVV